MNTSVEIPAEQRQEIKGDANDRFIRKFFSPTSAKKGFSYWYRRFNNTTEADAQLSLDKIVEEWGAKDVVTVVNQALYVFAQRKASTIIPDPISEKKKLLANNQHVLVSVDDAKKMVPGKKPESIERLLGQLKQATADKNLDKAKELQAQLFELLSQNGIELDL